jgi:hypothetical protein
MKKFIFVLAFVSLLKTASGQDRSSRFEFGSTLTTAKIYDPGYSRPSFEFVNGLFFRCTKKRLAIRAHVSYSNNTAIVAVSMWDSPYFWGKTVNNKDWKLGIGGQFSIFKQKDWLYTFLDISYRNIRSTGYEFGFNNDTFSSTSNGFDGFAGIGCSLKVIKQFYLSPEIGCYTSTQFVTKTITSADSYNVSTLQLVSYERSYSFTDINPLLKLHLTYKL